MSVFPTGMLQLHGNNIVQGMFGPNGPDSTELVFKHYYVGSAADHPDFEAHRQTVLHEWQQVFKEDIPFVRHVSENYKIRDFAGIETRFSPFWESNVHRFQRRWSTFCRQIWRERRPTVGSTRRSPCHDLRYSLMTT